MSHGDAPAGLKAADLPAPAAARPILNAHLFRRTPSGHLEWPGEIEPYLLAIKRVRCLLPGQVFEVVMLDDRRIPVQISPRLLCSCSDTEEMLTICVHIAAVLVGEDSPWIGVQQRDENLRNLVPRNGKPSETLRRFSTPPTPKSPREVRPIDTAAMSEIELGQMLLGTASGPREWNAYINGTAIYPGRRMLALIPEVWRDPALAADILSYGWGEAVAARCLASSPPHAFPEIFRHLSTHFPQTACELLEDARWRDRWRASLRPLDLMPLLRDPANPQTRIRASRALPSLKLTGNEHADTRTETSPTHPSALCRSL